MDGGHFTGLWVEVHVILKKRNWVNRKKKEKRKERETDALSDGTGPPHQEDQSSATQRRMKDYSLSISFHACSTHGDLIGQDGKYRQAAPARESKPEPRGARAFCSCKPPEAGSQPRAALIALLCVSSAQDH